MSAMIYFTGFCIAVIGLIFCMVHILETVANDPVGSEEKHVDGSF